MELNKREQLAFHTLREILDTFEKGEVLEVTNKEQNAIQEVFNINLYETTFRKSQIKDFKRGKDTAHIILINRINREPYPSGYFPFQIKEDKVKERAEEVAEIKKQQQEQIKRFEYYPIVDHFKRVIENGTEVYERDLLKAKEILTTNRYDWYGVTKEEKTELLELIIKIEKL